MGLDVSAYKQLTKLECEFTEDGEPIDAVSGEVMDNYVKVYRNDDFPGRAADLEDRAAYSYGGYCEGLSRAYSSYSRWRESLAKLAAYPLAPDDWRNVPTHSAGAFAAAEGPFWEVINFTDCDGTLGTATCAKLAKDFADWDDRAKSFKADDSRFYPDYQKMRTAFEFASDGGAVVFH